MAIARLRVSWAGSVVVGGGLSTFYGDTGSGGVDPTAVRAFFTSIRTLFPSGIDWDVPNGGDLLSEATGELTGTWSGTGGGLQTSGGTAAYASGVGARVAWRTPAIFRGRRVRGSTFLVPLMATQYETDGSLLNAARTTMQDAANALLAAPNQSLVVWSRPGPGYTGQITEISSADVPDKVSWLRSRRT